MTLRLIALWGLLFFASGQAARAATTALEQIQAQLQQDLEQYAAAQAANFGRRVGFQINRLDPRLNLPLCTQPVATEFDRNTVQSRVSVKVVCGGDQPWSMYVPVQVQAFQTVVAAQGSLRRGQRLDARDLALREIDVASLRYGFYANSENVLGLQLKRNLDAGEPLYPALLVAPEVISKGDEVTIAARGATMSVRMPGTALSDGKVGQQISVRNNSSERVIRATVVEEGLVEVQI